MHDATLTFQGSKGYPTTARFAALRTGLLEFVILGIASSSAVYAADIIRRLGDTELATQEGTLYPLLSKLRREGLLDYEWRESATGPPRKYYRVTDAGRAQFREFRAYWASLTGLIDEVGT